MTDTAPTDWGKAVSDEHLRVLGELTIHFGNLEFWLGASVWSLFEADSLITAQTVTAELSFRARLDLLESLARHKLPGEELLIEIREFASIARVAEQERNRIVHAHWMVDSEGSLLRMKYTARGAKGFRAQREVTTAEALDQVSLKVRDAADRASDVTQRLLRRFPIEGGKFTVRDGELSRSRVAPSR